jgi:hypothetical protein
VEGATLSTEKPQPQNVETGGGAFIGGKVDTGGGDFAGRDSVRPVVRGSVGNLFAGANEGGLVSQEDASVAGFQRALEEFAEQLKLAEMSPGLKKAIVEDVETVASETRQENPDKDLILHKVDSINQLLGKMAGAASSLTGLAEFAHRLLGWATQLFQ